MGHIPKELNANEVYQILQNFVKMERKFGASEWSIKIALRNMSRDAMSTTLKEVKT